MPVVALHLLHQLPCHYGSTGDGYSLCHFLSKGGNVEMPLDNNVARSELWSASPNEIP